MSEPGKFVGFARFTILDGDGVLVKTKGSRFTAFLHESKEGGNRKFTAYLPPSDQIRLLMIKPEKNHYLTGGLWAGAINEETDRLNPNKAMFVLDSVNCNTLIQLRNAEEEKLLNAGGDPDVAKTGVSIPVTMSMPFVSECHTNPVKASITICEEKHVARVTRFEVSVSETRFQEWYGIERALAAAERESKCDTKK